MAHRQMAHPTARPGKWQKKTLGRSCPHPCEGFEGGQSMRIQPMIVSWLLTMQCMEHGTRKGDCRFRPGNQYLGCHRFMRPRSALTEGFSLFE